MSVSLLSEPEVQALIQDLDLVLVDSYEGRCFRDDLRASVPSHCVSFEGDLVSLKSPVFDDLLEMYAKHNSKGCRRSFGCMIEKQFELF